MIKTEFASDLGLRPGEWPAQIVYKGQLLIRQGLYRDAEGDVMYASYSGRGTRLHIYND